MVFVNVQQVDMALFSITLSEKELTEDDKPRVFIRLSFSNTGGVHSSIWLDEEICREGYDIVTPVAKSLEKEFAKNYERMQKVVQSLNLSLSKKCKPSS
jgi:hypothetical protein